ncbi:unnamed protein product [Amoebophrya sp. A25]|nr:unnamed protein product [Amoebophrya sp. A25]|eukprot:GSA25T00011754001.1
MSYLGELPGMIFCDGRRKYFAKGKGATTEPGRCVHCDGNGCRNTSRSPAGVTTTNGQHYDGQEATELGNSRSMEAGPTSRRGATTTSATTGLSGTAAHPTFDVSFLTSSSDEDSSEDDATSPTTPSRENIVSVANNVVYRSTAISRDERGQFGSTISHENSRTLVGAIPTHQNIIATLPEPEIGDLEWCEDRSCPICLLEMNPDSFPGGSGASNINFGCGDSSSTICRANPRNNPFRTPPEKRDEDKLSVLACGHIFHHQCLAHWLSTRGHCPKCRRPVDLALQTAHASAMKRSRAF